MRRAASLSPSPRVLHSASICRPQAARGQAGRVVGIAVVVLWLRRGNGAADSQAHQVARLPHP